MEKSQNEVAVISAVGAYEQIAGMANRKLSVLKSGTKVAGLMGKKEWALANGIKGSANINRQYDLYVRKAGNDNRTQAAAFMAGADVLVKKFKLSKDGSKFSIEGTVAEKQEVDLSAATEDDVGSMLDRLQELVPGFKFELPKPAAIIEVGGAAK